MQCSTLPQCETSAISRKLFSLANFLFLDLRKLLRPQVLRASTCRRVRARKTLVGGLGRGLEPLGPRPVHTTKQRLPRRCASQGGVDEFVGPGFGEAFGLGSSREGGEGSGLRGVDRRFSPCAGAVPECVCVFAVFSQVLNRAFFCRGYIFLNLTFVYTLYRASVPN